MSTFRPLTITTSCDSLPQLFTALQFFCVRSRHLKNVSVDYKDVHYSFSEDGTLNETEIVIMNRHENQWKEVRSFHFFFNLNFCQNFIVLTRRGPLDRVQAHAGHSIAFNSMFALCDPVILTFDL